MVKRMEQQREENMRLIQKRKMWHLGMRKSVQEIKHFSKTISAREDQTGNPDMLDESLKHVKVRIDFFCYF